MTTLDELQKVKGLCIQERYKDALSHIDKTINKDPSFPLAICYKAIILSKLNRFDEAVSTIDDALAIDPSNPKYLIKKADIMMEGVSDLSDDDKVYFGELLVEAFNNTHANDKKTYSTLKVLFHKVNDTYHEEQCSKLSGRKPTSFSPEKPSTEVEGKGMHSGFIDPFEDPQRKELFRIITYLLNGFLDQSNCSVRVKSYILNLFQGEKDENYEIILKIAEHGLVERLIRDVQKKRDEKIIRQHIRNELEIYHYDKERLDYAVEFWVKTIKAMGEGE